MSSNTGVDGRTYLENLVNVTYKSPDVDANQYNFYDTLTSGTGAVQNGNGASGFLLAFSQMGNVPYDNSTFPPTIEPNISDLFAYFSNFSTTGIPPTIQDIMWGYVNAVNNSMASNGYGSWSVTADQLVQAAFVDYKNALTLGDWQQDIYPFPSNSDLFAQFTIWTNKFLKSLVLPAPPPADVLSYILTKMSSALAVSAGLTGGQGLYAEQTLSTFALVPGENVMPRYDSIYKVYFPDASRADYAAVLNQFYQDQVRENGYFNPSESLEAWTQKVVELSVPTPDGLPDITSLASIGADKTRILNNIYVLIATLLNSIQKIAAVQSNRLNLLTQWQQAYSQSLSTLHSFLSSDDNPVGHSTTDSTTISIRGEMNDIVNSNYRSLLQNNQSIIGDDAKSLQGNINQAQDEISQQNNRATAIIQELSTMLNAIFK